MAVNYLFLGQFGNFSVPSPHDIHMETITVLSTGLNFAGTMMIQFTWAYLGLSMDNFFITGNLATTLMAAQIALTGLENTYPDASFCYASSIALVYLFTAVLVWMFLYALCRVLEDTCGLPGHIKTRRIVFLILGYALPWSAIIPVSIMYTDNLINGRLCWLRGSVQWIFTGPLYFVCGFNFLVLLFLLGKRWQKDKDKEERVKISVRIGRFIMCFLAESQPLGFFWLFGLVPTNGYVTLPIHWIFVAIGGPQNLLMFFLFYCTHKTVLALLASHYEDTVAATLKEIQKRKAERGNVSSSYDDSD